VNVARCGKMDISQRPGYCRIEAATCGVRRHFSPLGENDVYFCHGQELISPRFKSLPKFA
jgi:hypothetical protein